MKLLFLLLLELSLIVPASISETKPSETTQSCVVIKHASAARQAFVSGANWQYVAGDFPRGMKWKSNIRDRDVRKIKKLGGRVVIVNQNYNGEDLKQAQESCKN
jgi:hypothetical protein